MINLEDLFGQLDATKIVLVLDLDYQSFQKQCFLINKLFMNHPKPPKIIQNHPKTTKISCNQPQTTGY